MKQNYSDPNADPVDVALIVVHGIGQQLRGATLLQWAEPLFQRMDYLSRSKKLDGASIRYASLLEDEPSQVYIDVQINEGKNRSIRVTEARWAESFLEAKQDAVLCWSAIFSIKAAWRVVRHIWRQSSRKLWSLLFGTLALLFLLPLWASHPVSSGIPTGVVAVVIVDNVSWLALCIGWLLSLLPALLVLYLLSIAVRLPIVGARLIPTVNRYTAIIGDATVWMTSPLRAAAMRDVVRRKIRTEKKSADTVVLLSHSQGAAISTRAVLACDTPLDCSIDTLITIGGATSLLLREEKFGRKKDEHPFRPVAEWAKKTKTRWIDFWAVYDPVPCGPVGDSDSDVKQRLHESKLVADYIQRLSDWRTDNTAFGKSWEKSSIRRSFWLSAFHRGRIRLRVEGQIRASVVGADVQGPIGPEERQVSNQGSFLRDHTTYTENAIQVIDPIARILLGPDFESEDTNESLLRLRSERNKAVKQLSFNRLFIGIIAAATALRFSPWGFKLLREGASSLEWQSLLAVLSLDSVGLLLVRIAAAVGILFEYSTRSKHGAGDGGFVLSSGLSYLHVVPQHMLFRMKQCKRLGFHQHFFEVLEPLQ
jgi:pimeloyl-ACP methyl ester carboxylesterase